MAEMKGQYIERSMSFIASSAPENGARNIVKNGSQFEVMLNQPIQIHPDAVEITLSVVSAAVWWVVPNISADLSNNQFRFTVGATPYSFEIAKGLYSLSALNNLISRECVNLGLAADTIVLVGDGATQQSVFVFNTVGVQIDLTGNDTPYAILGFDQRLVPLAPSTVAGQSEGSDSQAAFNTTNSFLLHSNIIGGSGLPVNSDSYGIIASVPIDVAPGSQIIYQPQNPLKVNARELAGKSLNAYRVWLTNEKNEEIDTNGEAFSFVGEFKYWLPVGAH